MFIKENTSAIRIFVQLVIRMYALYANMFVCYTSLRYINSICMKLTCIECKNEVDLSNAGEVKPEQVIECNHCGITLLVTSVSDDVVEVEIMDEGK